MCRNDEPAALRMMTTIVDLKWDYSYNIVLRSILDMDFGVGRLCAHQSPHSFRSGWILLDDTLYKVSVSYRSLSGERKEVGVIYFPRYASIHIRNQ